MLPSSPVEDRGKVETLKKWSGIQDRPPGTKTLLRLTSRTTTPGWASSNTHGLGKTFVHIYPQQSTTFKTTVAPPLVWESKTWHCESRMISPPWNLLAKTKVFAEPRGNETWSNTATLASLAWLQLIYWELAVAKGRWNSSIEKHKSKCQKLFHIKSKNDHAKQ